tara:strand:- start:126 stop:359 length:234 start_codon:yes stop_codon:yes gene_type:complete
MGARISVTDGGNPFGNPRKIYVAWDYSTDINQNHKQAAEQFIAKFVADVVYPSKPILRNPSVEFAGDQFHSWEFISE